MTSYLNRTNNDSPPLLLFFVLQVQEFLARFENIPDMLELDHLTVSGDVTFGKNVSLKVNDARRLLDLRPLRDAEVGSSLKSNVLKRFLLFRQGTVIIIANHGDRIDIPAGAMLENKIVSGNLRILDH